ncbi:MAG: hypothetical protein WD872_07595 [Pirellulaceae bacterium]
MQKYSHSGIVPPPAAIHTVLAGLATAAIGGVIYAFASYWLNIGLVRCLLMLVYAFSLGGIIAWMANRGKIRSPLFVTVVALLCAALGMWIYWGTYDVARHGWGVAGSAWTPQGLLRQGEDLFVNGSWALRGRRQVTGWLLVAIWIVEAVVVLFLASGAARADAARPFCETCLEWTHPTPSLLRLAADGNEPTWQEVMAGDLPALAVFEPTDANASPHVRLDLSSCPQCQHGNFVSLTGVTITSSRKGKAKTHEHSLIVNGQITDAEAEFLREFARQLHGTADGDPGDDDDDDGGDEDDEVENVKEKQATDESQSV